MNRLEIAIGVICQNLQPVGPGALGIPKIGGKLSPEEERFRREFTKARREKKRTRARRARSASGLGA